MKLFIKVIHSETYCWFCVNNYGDRINLIIGSPYKLLPNGLSMCTRDSVSSCLNIDPRSDTKHNTQAQTDIQN